MSRQMSIRLNESIISFIFFLQNLCEFARQFLLSNVSFRTVLKSPPMIKVFSPFSSDIHEGLDGVY